MDSYHVDKGSDKGNDRVAYNEFNDIKLDLVPIDCDGIKILLNLQCIDNLKANSNGITVDFGGDRKLNGTFDGTGLIFSFSETGNNIAIKKKDLVSIKRVIKKSL